MKPYANHNRLLLGKQGEDIAASYLSKKGFSIIQRNFRAGYGELDIITMINNILVFVEVKTRLTDEFGLPEEGVTPRKLREVKKTAEYFKSIHPELPDEMRIDVIGMILDNSFKITYFNHIENASG
jgi:putative endonuclease